MQTWEINLKVSVDETWIRDGFNITPEFLQELIEEKGPYLLPYAYSYELKIEGKVTKAPSAEKIVEIQESD